MNTFTEETTQETERETFHITDDASACWLLRRLATIEVVGRLTAFAIKIFKTIRS